MLNSIQNMKEMNHDKIEMDRLPIIDMSPLYGTDHEARDCVAQKIGTACRQYGFFYARGHGIPAELIERLEKLSRQFFSLPVEEKLEINMEKGGRAWRGYFPPLGELTSGRPDIKEGIYFGSQLEPDDPRVQAGLPLHGTNLFPIKPQELREAVLLYIEANARAAHALMEGIALSLGLEKDYFRNNYTDDPTILFRIFNYPSLDGLRVEGGQDSEGRWGVGEHTDYGLLTLLHQDSVGGLQVKTVTGWIEAPPVEGTLVCNLGDMLDRLTGGVYRSTPHRVRVNQSGRDRLSFPFFFDPGFDREVIPLPEHVHRTNLIQEADRKSRWDGESVHEIKGTYGEYLLSRVSRVFPELKTSVKI